MDVKFCKTALINKQLLKKYILYIYKRENEREL